MSSAANDDRSRFLSTHERRVLVALASAALPAGRLYAAADERTIAKVEAFLAGLGRAVEIGYRSMTLALDARSIASTGRTFDALPLGRRLEILDWWHRHDATRLTLRGLMMPIKVAHFDDEAAYAAAGCRFRMETPVAVEEPRWLQQITDARTFERDEEIECDAVVVGTGAGGAVVAKELAEAGWGVLMLEEGPYTSRKDLNGRPVEMMRRLYRRGGMTLALGNTGIPIPVGRGVGGTTMINAGTCLRAPDRTFAEWRNALGLPVFSSDSMDPYYTRVESMLRVEPARPREYGGPGAIIARGCDALGWAHRPLTRNAPDCDGQGLCCFGCPTDAKRSTNVSYIPAALDRSAQLLTCMKVDRILVARERAAGVSGTVSREDGRQVRVTVRAKVVVLACGSLHTPTLLMRNGLANASGQLGRNLSIHPATSAMALFNEDVGGARAIPQGYSIEEFHKEGILFEGSTAPLEITAAGLTGFGPAFVDVMEHFEQMLQFGYMVKDTSRGRVRPGPGSEPLITYSVNDVDLAKIKRGMELLCRVFFAAGAREVHTAVFGFERLRSLEDVDRLGLASLAARHFDLTAWHPLGTARMGTDPLRSVIDTTHETHDVHNLYITDGASVPGSLGVNPQMTIMAMATRASELIARRLERLAPVSAVA